MRGPRSIVCLALTVALLATCCGQVRIVTSDAERRQTAIGALDQPTNLGFERTVGHRPVAWRVTQRKGPYGFGVDESIKRSGKRSARIKLLAGDGLDGAFNQDLSAIRYAGKTIVVTAWIRTHGTRICDVCKKPNHNEDSLPEGPRLGAQVRVIAYGSNGPLVTETLVTPMVMGTPEWTRFKAKTAISRDAHYIIIAPILWGPGTAWFDDLSVSVK